MIVVGINDHLHMIIQYIYIYTHKSKTKLKDANGALHVLSLSAKYVRSPQDNVDFGFDFTGSQGKTMQNPINAYRTSETKCRDVV